MVRGAKSTMKEKVVGGFILAGIGIWAVSAMSRNAEEATMKPDLTLAEYSDLTRPQRLNRVTAAAEAVGAAAETTAFTACMGEFAATKSPSLPFAEVFGWCDMERTVNPDAFAAHFNELDAPDMAMDALSMCQIMIKDILTAPSSADFPFAQPIPRGRQRYLVKSYVDAQNAFGAMLRTPYLCEMQYVGGTRYELSSWKTIQFSVGD